ncbi:MAG TPA: glycosyltransferase family 39 protein [Acidobacteriota bacterium]|nr:glycosyltransferase family 39 protein [Acidobacteriota bacterium]
MNVEDERLDSERSELRWEIPLLAALTLSAGALRFHRLGDWSFWIDELFTIDRALTQYGTFADWIQHILPNSLWFPVSVMLSSGALQFFGVSEWSARAVPAAIGVLSIPALYFPARAIFGARVAILSAFLLAMSPWHLFWSQNARFYTALVLFYTLALLAFFLGLERNRPSYILFGILFFYLAFSERIFSLFLIPVMAFYLLACWKGPLQKPPGFNKRNLLLLASPLIVGLALEGLSLLTRGSSFTLGEMDWFFLYVNKTPLRLGGAVAFNVGVALAVLALMSGVYFLFQKNRAATLLLIGVALPLSMLIPASLFMFTEDRYLFGTLPGWILLASLGINEIWSRLGQRRKLLAAAFVAMLAADAAGEILLYFRLNHGNRREWREAFQLVRDRADSDDVVVAYWPEFSDYYLDREILPWADVRLETLTGRKERTWFVVDSETVWGSPARKRWVERNAELVEVFYLRTPEDLNLRVYVYDPSVPERRLSKE